MNNAPFLAGPRIRRRRGQSLPPASEIEFQNAKLALGMKNKATRANDYTDDLLSFQVRSISKRSGSF
jgi:hypothetical protein